MSRRVVERLNAWQLKGGFRVGWVRNRGRRVWADGRLVGNIVQLRRVLSVVVAIRMPCAPPPRLLCIA